MSVLRTFGLVDPTGPARRHCFKAYIESFSAPAHATSSAGPKIATSPSLRSSSRDLVIVAASGPCADYQKLVTMTEIKAMISFDACTSDHEIKANKSKYFELKAPIQSLMKSCKMALADLAGAKAALQKERLNKKKMKEEELKRCSTQDGSARKRSKSISFDILKREPGEGKEHYMVESAKAGHPLQSRIGRVLPDAEH